MTAFSNLVEVALEVERKPWLKDVFEELEPQAYSSVMNLLASPFFQFQPFGKWKGNVYGGYDGNSPCQVGFIRSMAKNKWATAGNRAGKTVLGMMEDVADALLIDPITKVMYADLPESERRFSEPPIHIWVVSDTEETAVQNVEKVVYEDILGEDETGPMWNMVKDGCIYSPKNGWSNHVIEFTNDSWIRFKFSTQKRKTFQGVKLHKVHLDEVQPKEIYSECSARLADLNGYMTGTMTPLEDKGVPWIYEELYLPREAKDIDFHQWSMMDNPHLPAEGRERLMRQWGEDEIEARVYGSWIPIGHKLAFDNKLIRNLRDQTTSPNLGFLEMDDKGKVLFYAS
tara:strand:- start:857 stop:1882 length:1026 start_codon:yes stop_codon:yes gene_type:complete